jgi:hypothetical protein
MKAIVVGRHRGEIPGIEEVGERRNVQFPAHSEECVPVLAGLAREAIAAECAVIFQAAPAQVYAALSAARADSESDLQVVRLGAVVSVPGERPGQTTNKKTFSSEEDAALAADLIEKVNPRAKVQHEANFVEVGVEAPMPFVFSHVEWL